MIKINSVIIRLTSEQINMCGENAVSTDFKKHFDLLRSSAFLLCENNVVVTGILRAHVANKVIYNKPRTEQG